MAKSLERIEQTMQGLDEGSFRYHVLDTAKKFKTSWLELGRALYTVWKDKKYKEWGYQTFDAYTSREIGIRKQTSMKLLRSYYFLEQEEPDVLKQDYTTPQSITSLPNYETIDVLRQAKNKKIHPSDYKDLKEKIFMRGKDAHEVRKDLTTLIRQRQELDPEEAIEKKKTGQLKRLLGTLKSLKSEIDATKMLPVSILKDLTDLIQKIEEYL